MPNDSKRDLIQRKLSRPNLTQKQFAPEKAILWEEQVPLTKEEAADQARRLSVAVFGSYRKDSVPRGRYKKV